MSNSDSTNTSGQTEQGTMTSSATDSSDTDTLVVVSKVKKLIKAKAGLNTGQCAIDALTKRMAEEITRGIENARNAGRKTVMGRDILSQ